jgi:alkylation response protein AidB-like acyl-CoA dehydrogenase
MEKAHRKKSWVNDGLCLLGKGQAEGSSGMGIQFTGEQIALRDLAKEFFEKEVRPVMAEIDGRPNAKDCYPAELVRKASKIGLKTLPLPEEYGGVNADAVTQALVFSTMTEVEPGTAKVLSQCWKVSQSIMLNGTEEQKKQFIGEFSKDPDYVFSISRTEPDSAGDNQLPYDGPEGGIKMTAVPDGDAYILNGTKSMSSLAGFSKCMVVYARTNRNVAARLGTTAFLVPYDLPGIRYGQVHNKMGYRCYPNGEVFFDHVRVPGKYMFGKMNEGHDGGRRAPWASVEMSALNLGVCRGMFKIALDHAKQRVQGGKPVIEHDSVGLMLAEMAMVIDTLEATLYDFASSVGTGMSVERTLKTRFARIYPRECFMKVMTLAMDVVASSAIMRDHPLEKLIRDGLTFLHGDGTSSLNRLRALPLIRKL